MLPDPGYSIILSPEPPLVPTDGTATPVVEVVPHFPLTSRVIPGDEALMATFPTELIPGVEALVKKPASLFSCDVFPVNPVAYGREQVFAVNLSTTRFPLG